MEPEGGSLSISGRRTEPTWGSQFMGGLETVIRNLHPQSLTVVDQLFGVVAVNLTAMALGR